MTTNKRKNVTALGLLPVGMFALVLLPIGMIYCALLEARFFRTSYLTDIAEHLGVDGAFKALHDALAPILGW